MIICFIGHRTITNEEHLIPRLKKTILNLIENGADTFLFGSKSQFDDICFEIVSEFQINYPNIKRVYVRSSYPTIDSSYKEYLLDFYDETYFPKGVENAGRCSYIKRNQNMIDVANICVFYYNSEYIPPVKKAKKHSSLLPTQERKSGSAIAYNYAKQKNKQIINLFTNEII